MFLMQKLLILHLQQLTPGSTREEIESSYVSASTVHCTMRQKKATIVLLSQNATYSLHNYTTGAEIKEREGEKGKQTIADIEDEYALKTRRCDQTL